MQICKKSKGITLVALIITIIVLLILAGVSISFVLNEGILDKAQQAVDEYKNASINEQQVINQIDKYLQDEIGGGSGVGPTEPEVPKVDEDGLAKEDTTIVAKDDSSIQIVIPEGFAPAILETGTTQSLPGENGSVSSIMPAKEWNNITKEDINKGIVVVDNKITYDGGKTSGIVSDFNEYVWIPMPDISKFERIAWTTPYGWNESVQYVNTGITHNLSEVASSKTFWEEKDTQEYKDMVNSVNTNKGFYIGRYEASVINDRTQSKRNQTPSVNMTSSEVISICSNMNEKLNSHLMYGIEWDSMLNWLIGNAVIGTAEKGKTKVMELTDVQDNSTNWGNSRVSIGDAQTNAGVIRPTGYSEYWKANNIYDLAGNVWEYTQERYDVEYYVCRGGIIDDYDNIFTVIARYYLLSSRASDRGFRVSFYI